MLATIITIALVLAAIGAGAWLVLVGTVLIFNAWFALRPGRMILLGCAGIWLGLILFGAGTIGAARVMV